MNEELKRAVRFALKKYQPNQETFEFNSPGYQEFMGNVKEKRHQSDDRLKKALEQARKKEPLRVVSSHNNPFMQHKLRSLEASLEMPLFTHVPSELDVQPAEEPDDEEFLRISETEFECGSEAFPTDEMVVELHEHLLDYSLKLLASKGNAEEKYDTIRWIWEPAIYSDRGAIEIIDGVEQRTCAPVYARNLKFTFETCCRLAGYNPNLLRTYLANKIRPMLKEFGFEFIIKQECQKS